MINQSMNAAFGRVNVPSGQNGNFDNSQISELVLQFSHIPQKGKLFLMQATM
jgi:hypothetical protein